MGHLGRPSSGKMSDIWVILLSSQKIKLKLKKAIGEDDIESVVKAIEEEERKRLEVKEVPLDGGGPSHRSNLSLVAHPENPELVFFGGELECNILECKLNNP